MRARKTIKNILLALLLVTVSAFFLFPILMAALNSLKPDGEILRSVLALPEKFDFSNYKHVLNKLDIMNNFKNNIVLTTLSVAGIVVCSSLAGYKLSRTPGKLSNLIFILIWASMIIPFYSIMFPLIQVSQALHIKESLAGLALIYIGLGINFAIFLYHGFVKSIPREMEEAAAIDGCGQLKCFTRIVFPMLAPITMTIIILDVLWVWNDFLLPLVMISKQKNYTLVLVASSFFGRYTTEWGYILAILMLTSLPVIVFYLIFQKYIVKGIADGAVKG